MGPAPDYKPLPMLADSWETEYHQTWIFHFNKNSKFHDGVSVTVESEYAAIKSGEIEMIGYNGIDPLSIKWFEGKKDIEVKIDLCITLDWLTFNLHKKNAISDLNVRKAIMYGIDKKRIIDLAAMGYADPDDSFVYTKLSFHNPNLNKYDYNPQKARDILAGQGTRIPTGMEL